MENKISANNSFISVQIISRAGLWIFFLSSEIITRAIMNNAPQDYRLYLITIAITAVLFTMTFFLGEDDLIWDMRELCLYDVFVQCAGLMLHFYWYNLPLYTGLCYTIVLLKFARLLWPLKNNTNDSLAYWPIFGILGYFRKKRKKFQSSTDVDDLSKHEKIALMFVILSFPFILILREIGLRMHLWLWATVSLLLVVFFHKPFISFLNRQHAHNEEMLKRVILAEATADKERAITLEKERHNQLLAAKNVELEQANTELAQANAEIQALLAEQAKDKALLEKFNASLRDASHDLQHPMAVVRIHADALTAMSEEEFWDKEKWREVAERLDFAMEEMTDMIDATVHSAQVVTGIVKPDVRVIDMNALLKKFNQLWLNGPNRRGLDYMLTYPTKHAGLYCPFDLIILKRILRNLIANAIQHSATDKGILLAIRRRGERCVIEVRDSGPGIPEGLGKDKAANFAAFANRIREEGSQVKQSGSRSGYRLGMSNVLQLCAATGLEMRLCAIPERGSKFSFSLPLARADQFEATIHIRNGIEAQWKEAGDLLEAYADLPMADGDFFPEDDDLERYNLMPNSSNGVDGTPG